MDSGRRSTGEDTLTSTNMAAVSPFPLSEEPNPVLVESFRDRACAETITGSQCQVSLSKICLTYQEHDSAVSHDAPPLFTNEHNNRKRVCVHKQEPLLFKENSARLSGGGRFFNASFQVAACTAVGCGPWSPPVLVLPASGRPHPFR